MVIGTGSVGHNAVHLSPGALPRCHTTSTSLFPSPPRCACLLPLQTYRGAAAPSPSGSTLRTAPTALYRSPLPRPSYSGRGDATRIFAAEYAANMVRRAMTAAKKCAGKRNFASPPTYLHATFPSAPAFSAKHHARHTLPTLPPACTYAHLHTLRASRAHHLTAQL